jgi:peptidoglycan/LPS O-acetylase OafA/YrhL
MLTLWCFTRIAAHAGLGDLTLVLGFPLSILAGAAVHQWIEKPLLAAMRRPAASGAERVAVA